MNMTITSSQEKFEEGLAITVVIDFKKEFFFFVTTDYVNITVNNASHKVWRGLGKSFNDFDEMRKAYKSSATLSAIDEAERIFVENLLVREA